MGHNGLRKEKVPQLNFQDRTLPNSLSKPEGAFKSSWKICLYLFAQIFH